MAGILMIGVKALEKRAVELQAENADLKERLEGLIKDRPYLTTASTETTR